jgi:hypothetical protein
MRKIKALALLVILLVSAGGTLAAKDKPSVQGLCVPKTLSVLIGGGNHLTSAHNDRAAMLCP